jgi:hypothetical protein
VDRVRGVRLKIERAKKHIQDLDLAIRAFCNSEDTYTLAPKDYPEIAHVGLQIDYVRPIPGDIGLGIGDAVHNLRSSLDHLAWQLVEAGGGTPNKDTYFPICQSEQQYASAIGKGEIGKMRIGTHKILEAVQPYTTHDDTLWHIHDLDRVDKHRLILTVVGVMKSWGVRLGLNNIQFPVMPGEPLVRGYEVMRLPTGTYQRHPHKDFELGLDITFGQFEIVAGKPVLETLDGMAKLVSNIISKFEPFLI